MRAVSYSRYGGIDALGISDLPVPHHGPLSVLVRVVTAAINPVDYQIREGWEAEWLPATFPMIPGIDVAGVVVELGADTPDFAVGDHVIAHAGKDFVGGGTLAEYVEIPARNAAIKPTGLSWEQAATLPIAAQTALQAVRRSGLDASSTVFIHAATGGVGSFATQLAARAGARVFGSASPRNHDYLRALGAEPIDYHGDLVAAARRGAPAGFDVILDCAGRSALDSTPDLLKPGGTVVSIADFRARDEFRGIFVWENPNSADLTEVGGLAASGELDTDIAAVYDLNEFAEAFALLESGSMRGKIVVRVSAP